jgi:DNA-directed RNA polymerase beta subunit
MAASFGDAGVGRSDMLAIMTRVAQDGGAAHHLDSMDQFISAGLDHIIKRGFGIQSTIKNKRVEPGEESQISEIKFSLHFESVSVFPPVMRESVIDRATPAAAAARAAAASAEDADAAAGSADLAQFARTARGVASAASVGALYPYQARQLSRTYSNELRVSAEIEAIAYRERGQVERRTARISDFRIGAIPCMIRSASCNLRGMSREQLVMMRENPSDLGGYFILRGQEYSVDCTENTTVNEMRVSTEERPKEDARVQVWSRFGDGFENSYQFIMRHHQNGGISIDSQFFSLKDIQIPFHVFLRMLANVRDSAIAEMVIGDLTLRDPNTVSMIARLNAAFTATYDSYGNFAQEYDQANIVYGIGEKLLDLPASALAARDENVRRMTYAKMMDQIDTRVLPHLGMGEGDRMKKARYICYAMRKMFMSMAGVIDSLDRDSLANKRIHTAGISVAKAFKTMLSHTVITPMRRAFQNAFDNTPFAQVDLQTICIGSIRHDELEDAMKKALTVGNTDMQVGRTVSKNRVSSQARYLKNDLNARAIACNIAVMSSMSNKQTERADQLRRVHSSYTGYGDPTQSADTGDKVGMNKQMAVSAIISIATSGDNLKQAILAEADPDFARLEDVTMADVVRGRLSCVFVNGDWIGCVRNDWVFVAKWREYRRTGKGPMIHRHTSIIWDPCYREVRFWTDFGRMLRPLVIVYNNLEEVEAKCAPVKMQVAPGASASVSAGADADFAPRKGKGKKKAPSIAPPSPSYSREVRDDVEFAQWTRLTPEIVAKFASGEMTMVDMQERGVIEYIAADECENMYLAQSIAHLHAERHNITSRYTHCDIEQAIHGIVVLSSPLVDHTYGIRTTYFGNQRKQSAAWYDLAYPYRCDKKMTLQLYCEHPIVTTLADKCTCPNGQNCVIALMIHGGFNQEDSVYINASAIQRGLFNGAFFDYEVTHCEQGEMFATPDKLTVVDRYSSAVTDFLVDGNARVGSIVKHDYVLISKVAAAPDTDKHGAARFIDRSIIYSGRTPARVTSVVVGTDDRGAKFTRVCHRQVKDGIRGDKVSSRTGNKGIIARILNACDMPVTESGIIPDIVVNPQSIPTRRALNQLIEMVCGINAAQLGHFVDATSSMPVDVEEVIAQLKAHGVANPGYERMYNGATGDWLSPTFIGIATYQRLEKFVDNECRAIRHGPVDAITRQPVRGGVDRGALRIGEMEAWTLLGHGAARSFAEIFSASSDGTTVHICERCQMPAIYNPASELYSCRACGQFARIAAVASSWSSTVLMSEIRTLGIRAQFELEPRKFYKKTE